MMNEITQIRYIAAWPFAFVGACCQVIVEELIGHKERL